jgi:hypothetical protein
MSTNASSDRCQDLLAEMGQIPVIIPGKLCKRHNAEGKLTGWKLQQWRNGSNKTRYIPAGLVEQVQEGTTGHQQFMTLACEYAEAKGEEALKELNSTVHSKKKLTRR